MMLIFWTNNHDKCARILPFLAKTSRATLLAITLLLRVTIIAQILTTPGWCPWRKHPAFVPYFSKNVQSFIICLKTWAGGWIYTHKSLNFYFKKTDIQTSWTAQNSRVPFLYFCLLFEKGASYRKRHINVYTGKKNRNQWIETGCFCHTKQQEIYH